MCSGGVGTTFTGKVGSTTKDLTPGIVCGTTKNYLYYSNHQHTMITRSITEMTSLWGIAAGSWLST